MIWSIWSVLCVLLGFGCAATAQAPAPLDHSAPVDLVLDALDARGRNLTSFSADVALTESDPNTGDQSTRTGRVWLSTPPDAPARFRATFDKKQTDNLIIEDRVEYLLDGPNLIDRSYRGKTQVTRQVLKPGERINLLKLGEGPFPLPIGQPKEQVHKLFDVRKVDAKSDDPADTIHIELLPRAGTQFQRQFKSLDVWVNLADGMPMRIETLDPNGSLVRTTDLSNVQMNPKLADADFALPPIDDSWQVRDEAFED